MLACTMRRRGSVTFACHVACHVAAGQFSKFLIEIWQRCYRNARVASTVHGITVSRVHSILCAGRQQLRDSIVVSISACHAEDPGSIPGRGI